MIKHNIQFETSTVASNTLYTISKTIRFIQFFYHNSVNVNNYKEKPLPTDELPFLIEDSSLTSDDELKNAALSWLSQKALEDFILGINLGLMELNKLIRIQTFSKSTVDKPIDSPEEIDEKITVIEKKVQGLNLPTMISEVEKWLGKELRFKSDILSINKSRACFAHRNGIVSNLKDINDEENKSLRISWVRFKTEVQLEDGNWEKLTYGIREDGIIITAMRIMEEGAFLSFKDQEKITLDIESLNGIGLTCINFIQHLHEEAQEIFKRMKE